MNHLGIITPLIPEAECFTQSPVCKNSIKITDKISLMVSGEGKSNAHASAKKLLDDGVDGLMVIGMAGALDPELSPGDLVIPDNVMTASNQVFHCHHDWSHQLCEQFKLEKNKIITLPLFTADEVITGSADKISLYEQFNAGAVDMEASVIVALANEHQVPCTVMRAIIDPADYSFPDYLMEITNEFGEVAISRLLISALTRPGQMNKLIQLLGFYNHARETLKILAKNPEYLIASPH